MAGIERGIGGVTGATVAQPLQPVLVAMGIGLEYAQLRLAGARKSMELSAAAVAGRDAGRNYITIASEFLGQDA